MKSKKKKILIIERDKFVVGQIQKNLDSDNYKFLEANNGWEGLETAIEHIPDLIISNKDLPQLSGVQLSREIKKYGVINKIPFLLTSTFVESGKHYLQISFESKIFSLDKVEDEGFASFIRKML